MNSGSKMSAQSETRFGAAMIGTRYVETILKSQQNMILNESNKTEKERFRKKKANTEAEIRVVKMELKKMQRLKEMQIARLEMSKPVALTSQIQIGFDSHQSRMI